MKNISLPRFSTRYPACLWLILQLFSNANLLSPRFFRSKQAVVLFHLVNYKLITNKNNTSPWLPLPPLPVRSLRTRRAGHCVRRCSSSCSRRTWSTRRVLGGLTSLLIMAPSTTTASCGEARRGLVCLHHDVSIKLSRFFHIMSI